MKNNYKDAFKFLFKEVGQKVYKIGVAFFAIIGLFSVYNFLDDIGFFGLNGNSTAGEYLEADFEEQLEFELNEQCKDGECLRRVDWDCGFSLNTYFSNDNEPFIDCFYNVVKHVQEWETLDKIGKYCGLRVSKFDPSRQEMGFANPERCEKFGGRWGVKLPVPLNWKPRN